MAYYADTSALVKLVVSEAESDALRAWIGESDRGLVSCDLARTELMRAARRALPDQMLLVRAVLDSITLTRVSTATFDEAGRLDPTVVRTTDAIHLAAALELGDDLAGMITYDDRLAEAARANGIGVIAPR